MKRKKWSQEEVEFLTENYDLLGAKFCAKKLNVSPEQISHKLNSTNPVTPKPRPKNLQVCSTCEEIKTLDKFYKSSKGRNGYHASCIDCFNKRDKERFKNDLEFRIVKNLRRRFKRFVKNNFSTRKEKILGCSPQELKQYLESLWLPGMTWENYGFGADKWNIDHIEPCCSFDLLNEIEQEKCFHYTNLRPLWQVENFSKAAQDKKKKLIRN